MVNCLKVVKEVKAFITSNNFDSLMYYSCFTKRSKFIIKFNLRFHSHISTFFSIHEAVEGDENKKTEKTETKTKDERAWAGAQASNHNNGVYSAGAEAGAAAHKKGNHEAGRASAKAEAQAGPGGVIIEAGVDATGYNYDNDKVEVNVGHGRLEGGVGAGAGGVKAGFEAGVDAVNGNVDLGKNVNVGANIGLNVDTGVEFGVGGVSAKVAGWGVSVGCKNEVCTWFGCVTIIVC